MASSTAPPIGVGIAPRSVPGSWYGQGGGGGGGYQPTRFSPRGFKLAAPRGPHVQPRFDQEPPPPEYGGLVGTRTEEPLPPPIRGEPWTPPQPGQPAEPPLPGVTYGPPEATITGNPYAGIKGFESWGFGGHGPGPYGRNLWALPGRRGNPTRDRVQDISDAMQRLGGGPVMARRGGQGHGIGLTGPSLDYFRKILQAMLAGGA